MNVMEVAEVEDDEVVDEVRNQIHQSRMNKNQQKLLKMIVLCHPERMFAQLSWVKIQKAKHLWILRSRLLRMTHRKQIILQLKMPQNDRTNRNTRRNSSRLMNSQEKMELQQCLQLKKLI
jgi:hypothetical protein